MQSSDVVSFEYEKKTSLDFIQISDFYNGEMFLFYNCFCCLKSSFIHSVHVTSRLWMNIYDRIFG